jgi:hypothetical protein
MRIQRKARAKKQHRTLPEKINRGEKIVAKSDAGPE